MSARLLLAAAAVLAAAPPAPAQPKPGTQRDVIYAKRDGLALTMDVVVPPNPNGRGVVLCVSGGFQSREEYLRAAHLFVVPAFAKAGYTVFAVMHGSQPRYTVPEIVGHVHQAVRFVKSKADDYKIDPDKLGMAGMSSGGHLSLMMGCAWEDAKPGAADPLERYSSKVAAVACFFPPTDFVQLDRDELDPEQRPFRTLFDVRRLDPKTNKLERVTDAERREFGRRCSPLYCAKDRKDAAPTFIVHGRRDTLVPVHQSQMLHDLMRECGAVCKLDVEDIGHDAAEALKFLPRLVEWFDARLK
ncbi:MAG: alpha/beta hydrolase [Isosphaera sp.]|nr:alpha/beta hydrolase [Isosphaera sp.]